MGGGGLNLVQPDNHIFRPRSYFSIICKVTYLPVYHYHFSVHLHLDFALHTVHTILICFLLYFTAKFTEARVGSH